MANKRQQVDQKVEKAMSLLATGKSMTEVAEILEYASTTGLRAAIDSRVKNRTLKHRETIIAVELAKLDEGEKRMNMLEVASLQRLRPDKASKDKAVPSKDFAVASSSLTRARREITNIADRRARLTGLNAADQVDVSHKHSGKVNIILDTMGPEDEEEGK